MASTERVQKIYISSSDLILALEKDSFEDKFPANLLPIYIPMLQTIVQNIVVSLFLVLCG